MEKGRRTTSLGLTILSVMVRVMAVAVLLWAVGSAGASPPMGPLAQGGAPLLLNYQGRLADPTTSLPKPDGTYTITFKIYDAETDGSLVWSETQVVSVTRGLFNVLLGSSTALSASDFDGTSRWLELEVEGETLSPRERIVSVPYAIQAEEARNADTVDGFHASELGGDYQNVVVVAKSGGDYTSIQDALDSITDASASNPYLVWVAPGTYTETVTMKQYVDIEGAGELGTKITYTGSGSASTGTVVGANNAELRFLTVENTGTADYATAIYNSSVSPRLTHVTAIASGGSTSNSGVRNYNSSPTMTNVTATASGGTYSSSVFNNSNSSPTMTNVTATASGGTYSSGVLNYTSSSPTMIDVTATASGGNYNYGVHNEDESSPTMTNVTATASGGTSNRGVYNNNSSPTMTDVTATASGGSNNNSGVRNTSSSPTIQNSVISGSGGTWNYGIRNSAGSGAYTVTVNNSQITGSTNTILNDSHFATLVGASLLDGGEVDPNGGTITCTGVYDESYTQISGCSSPYFNMVVVAKSGGGFTSIQAALSSITDASASNPYLVWVAPGTYTETVTMKQYVDIEGAGELVTKITYTGSGLANTGTVVGADNAELRFLTVENTGGDSFGTAIYNDSASPRLTHVTATASGGTYHHGVYNQSSSPTMTDVTATASGGNINSGVYNYSDSSPMMTNVSATASGGNYSYGVRNDDASSPTMTNVTATASGGTNNFGVRNNSSSPTIQNSVIGGSGGTNNYGIYNYASSGSYTVTVDGSEITGSTYTILNDSEFTTLVGASLLNGGAVAGTGTRTCAGVYDESYTFYSSTCP